MECNKCSPYIDIIAVAYTGTTLENSKPLEELDSLKLNMQAMGECQGLCGPMIRLIAKINGVTPSDTVKYS